MDSPAGSKSDYNDDPLVSHPGNPVTIPIDLVVQSLACKGRLVASWTWGAPRLVNLALVQKLGMRFRHVKVPIAFCQLDGSVAGGIPATFITEPIEVTMGANSDPELYCGPWHGETTCVRTLLTSEVEPLCELEEGVAKDPMGQLQRGMGEGS